MASIGMLGFLGGASGQALEAIKSRQDEEREMRKARMLEELRRDTAIYLADYQEKLEAKKVDDKLSTFDPTTGEFVMRNTTGSEIGRRKDAGMSEAYEYERQDRSLSLESKRANIDQSRASAAASRAAAENSRAYAARARRGLDGSDDKFTNEDRLATVNKIEKNLQSYGFSQEELAKARQQLLAGVRKGWTLEQFVEFEKVYFEEMNKGRTKQLSELKAAEEIFGKAKKPE